MIFTPPQRLHTHTQPTMRNYIPNSDSAASAWATNFATVGNANQARYKLSAGTAAALVAAAAAFAAALVTATDPATRTAATVAAKDTARADMETLFRPVATQISKDATITAEHKVEIGVTVPTTTRTPVPAPTTAPAATLRSIIPGQVTVEITDPNSGGQAKPAGVIATQIAWVAGTAFTADPTPAVTQAVATKALVVLPIPPAAAGQKISLFARYQTRSGPGGQAQFGPWSTPLNFHGA